MKRMEVRMQALEELIKAAITQKQGKGEEWQSVGNDIIIICNGLVTLVEWLLTYSLVINFSVRIRTWV